MYHVSQAHPQCWQSQAAQYWTAIHQRSTSLSLTLYVFSFLGLQLGQYHSCWCKLEQLERLCSEDTPAASWLPIPLSHIGCQVKRRQSQSYKVKEFAKISNFLILKQTLQATHLLKVLDKMCKYEMDPMSIVEDTERTQILSTDGQTAKVKPVYPPFNFVEEGV